MLDPPGLLCDGIALQMTGPRNSFGNI